MDSNHLTILAQHSAHPQVIHKVISIKYIHSVNNQEYYKNNLKQLQFHLLNC